MNAALQADLGRTPISGLRGAPPHLLEIEHIGWTAQVLRRPFRKGAEAAFVKADIGVIDIAVDDVGHRIANHLPPQFVGRTGDERSEERRVGKEVVSTCRSRWSPYHEKKKNKP